MDYQKSFGDYLADVTAYAKEVDITNTCISFYRIMTRQALEEVLLEEDVDLVEHRHLIGRIAAHSIPSLSVQELDNMWYKVLAKSQCGEAISSTDNIINPIATV